MRRTVRLKIRTKRPIETLKKPAARGYAAYVQFDYGWIRITPEGVEHE